MKAPWGQMKKWNQVFILTCFLSLLGFEFAWAESQGFFHAYAKPMPVPDFSLENLQEKLIKIQDYRGQVVLLNFWATW